ncbi:uncharacterized protein C7orf57-like isoform X1 [Scleropages formosus]|uniref:uncharacterized protein C7orf57-like isoform X1 n=2 Tax=Scleropages formosus TaxID=113540 RepID=UPI000F34C4AA|nr:uncharacterized protein C7orf57-like isoform X1 [Scleropages formosus]
MSTSKPTRGRRQSSPRSAGGCWRTSSDMSSDTDHRRKKHGIKTYHLGEASGNGSWAPASQIPGLSPSAGSVPQEKARGRRVGILETDSDYVKLAKQGGQKGLLWHEDTSMETKTGSQYKAPDWFSADSDSQEECRKHGSPDGVETKGEETKQSPGKGTFQPLSAPFGGDNKSAWERDRDGAISGPQNVFQANQALEKMSLSSGDVQQANKYKRISYEKKAAPVNMSKLLSFGYVEDEKKSPSEDDASSVTSDPIGSTAPEGDAALDASQ